MYKRGNKPVNITGEVYGELTALRPTSDKLGSNIVWECLCSCGKVVRVSTSNLRSGRTKSCGHLRSQNARERLCVNLKQAVDITGKRFGRLVAERRIGSRIDNGKKTRPALWLCRCDCGGLRICAASALNTGHIKSCGCTRKIPKSDEYAITCPSCGQKYRTKSLEDAPPLCPVCMGEKP